MRKFLWKPCSTLLFHFWRKKKECKPNWQNSKQSRRCSSNNLSAERQSTVLLVNLRHNRKKIKFYPFSKKIWCIWVLWSGKCLWRYRYFRKHSSRQIWRAWWESRGWKMSTRTWKKLLSASPTVQLEDSDNFQQQNLFFGLSFDRFGRFSRWFHLMTLLQCPLQVLFPVLVFLMLPKRKFPYRFIRLFLLN